MVVQDPPNFLVASDFSKHVKPVAVVPDDEPEADADNDSVENLIDTTLPDVSLQFVSVSKFGVDVGVGLGWMQP